MGNQVQQAYTNGHNQGQHSLYQQAMLAHHKSPVGFEQEINVSHSADGVNPACGDEIRIDAELCDDHISHLAFFGDSCAICRASASMLCQFLRNQPVAQALAISQQLQLSLDKNLAFTGQMAEHFAPLGAVAKFPVRKQCALLPWSTLDKVLKKTLNESEV
ncbi:iron-sulfur cluster assembly scaffold protein [Thalassotalea insulae]|uniref:Iron-sulfur cluster assembly scaffold protein n=1 Tax=Thalassotalea insulae TaxID=2056778 RepID=A0ABQ6GYM4_9GAMM|nr:SUF system NifU family Fe-S cluster assembly protein [Thalassotalea insulae]GLX79311.1 iron-sulfur cluster assembly scaffold protein [Thalassotalea insulae]